MAVIEDVDDVMSVPHACAFPVSSEQLYEMRARFVAGGLVRGEQVIYFDDGTIDQVLQRLADDRVPTRAPIARGQLAIVGSADTRAAMAQPAPVIIENTAAAIDAAHLQGFPAMRLTGDTGYGFEGGYEAALLEFEAGIDDMLAAHPAKIMCVYDQTVVPEAALERVRALHHTEITAPAIYDDGLLRITAHPAGTVRLAGEVDHSNQPRIKKVLAAGLDAALRSHTASTDITLDLSSLRFVDVAGVTSLVHSAEEFPSTHRLVLTGVRPNVARVLDRCGAPFATQLVVQARVDADAEASSPADPDADEDHVVAS